MNPEKVQIGKIYKISRPVREEDEQTILTAGTKVRVIGYCGRCIRVVDMSDCVKGNGIYDIVDDTLEECEQNTESEQAYNSHYAAMPVQPLEVMQAIMPRHEVIGFLKGNIIKYSMRAGHKQGESAAKDAAKAKRYAEWLEAFEAYNSIELNKTKED